MTRKDWKKRGAKGDKGKGTGGKGKKGNHKGRGKGDKGGTRDAVRDWSSADLTKDEKRAIANQRWKAWMTQAGK